MAWRNPYLYFGLIAIVLAGLITLGLVVFTPLGWFLDWIIAATIVTFGMYGYDKAQAKRDGLRVPELVLHACALAGGFLGGWAGRLVFHHKTLHRSFTVVLVISTVLYAALFAYWLWK
jgi:uncharacterized membrane protein YsdA (DUF1294 family)